MTPPRNIRALVVDDDREQIRGWVDSLRAVFGDDSEITAIVGAGNALQFIQDTPLDVVLVRAQTNQAAQDVRALKSAAPSIPLIVLSAIEDEAFAMTLLHSGAQDCLFVSQLGPQLLSRAVRYAIERAQAQEQIAYLAHYDRVTELPNRVLFRDRLEQAIAHAQRHGKHAAVLVLDLDFFKSVNDLLGHDAGDSLLKDVADRIKSQLRRGDTLARMGGDEFAIILEDISDHGAPGFVAQKILDSMARAYRVSGEEMFISTSIGIAAYPACGIEAAQLTQNADTALYNAKAGGRGCFRFFDDTMNAYAAERAKTVSLLRRAIERNEFEIAYQPVINTATRDILGFEALLRWNHPERGVQLPGQFIGLLEESGLIASVGEWVLRTACVQHMQWRGAGHERLVMAVNVSARQFRQKDFVAHVSTVLRDTGMDPADLQIEITESMLVENIAAAAAKLRALHTLGVRFSIDDFGTGYSSLNYLKRFPISVLKLDRSFLETIAEGDDAAIVNAIISLGHSLRMKVVAEGVENDEQLRFLERAGCDAVQGFYFAKPMRADDAIRWLGDRRQRVVPVSGNVSIVNTLVR